LLDIVNSKNFESHLFLQKYNDYATIIKSMVKDKTTKFLTENYSETQELGKSLAEEIKGGQKAVVLGLKGDLGAGKTTFLQGFAKGLGVKEKVTSPTFVIMNRFDVKKGKFKNFYHLDCYRIEKFKEMENLGFEEIINNSKNIVCIEWPEKIKRILPEDIILIKFKIGLDNKREITIDYGK
jgi:tRNA threonylcarbamoyladenosine biosynthesis protein TsaE